MADHDERRQSGADARGGVAGASALRPWASWFEPLARELRDTAPGSRERDQCLARQIDQLREQAVTRTFDAASAPPSDLAAGLHAAASPLGPWPAVHGALRALSDALAAYREATVAASRELEAVIEGAGAIWRRDVGARATTVVTADDLAEAWSAALERAWDERLAAGTGGAALGRWQRAEAELRDALADGAGHVLALAGLPGPGAIRELEEAVDRLDRAFDRDLAALRDEVADLRAELRAQGRGPDRSA